MRVNSTVLSGQASEFVGRAGDFFSRFGSRVTTFFNQPYISEKFGTLERMGEFFNRAGGEIKQIGIDTLKDAKAVFDVGVRKKNPEELYTREEVVQVFSQAYDNVKPLAQDTLRAISQFSSDLFARMKVDLTASELKNNGSEHQILIDKGFLQTNLETSVNHLAATVSDFTSGASESAGRVIDVVKNSNDFKEAAPYLTVAVGVIASYYLIKLSLRVLSAIKSQLSPRQVYVLVQPSVPSDEEVNSQAASKEAVQVKPDFLTRIQPWVNSRVFKVMTRMKDGMVDMRKRVAHELAGAKREFNEVIHLM